MNRPLVSNVLFRRASNKVTLLENVSASLGEIAYCSDTRELYVYGAENSWIKLSDYKSSNNVECSKKLQALICTQCGAPLESKHKCDYCGTTFI